MDDRPGVWHDGKYLGRLAILYTEHGHCRFSEVCPDGGTIVGLEVNDGVGRWMSDEEYTARFG